MQEFRALALNYSIPIISATQGTRESEDAPVISNKGVADSYKKVRYADYLYMVRMRGDLDLNTQDVKSDISGENDQLLSFNQLNNEYNSYLKPYEIKITKAKDGTKDVSKFHIFNGKNCRIYQKLENVYKDMPELEKKSGELTKKLQLAKLSSQDNEFNFSTGFLSYDSDDNSVLDL
jgi:hypothetical protein